MITIDGKTYRTLPEQVEENTKDIAKIETDNVNIQGAMSELRNQVNYTAQRLIEAEETVAELEGKVYDPISSATIIADKDDENKEVAFTLAADITAKVDNSLQTPRSSPANTILVGVDSTRSQCNIAIGDGLVIEDDTLKATADPRLEIVEDDVNSIKSKKWYEHNIIINFRTSNERIASANSEGSFLATLTIINQDPTAYTFTHNQDYSTHTPKVMDLQTAWQLLRLYRAIQLSTQRDLNLQRSCSGALVQPETASPYTAHYCINNSISTKYYDFTDTDWKRMMVVHATRVGSGNVGTYTIEVSVGHPTFIGGEETSLWTNRDEFAAGEYNLTDSFGNSYSTYFCQQRMYCTDVVRELIGFN